MNFKPDESMLMAYLYDELTSEQRAKVEEYLAIHPEARKQLEQLQQVHQILQRMEDKEVIAPPIVLEDRKSRFFWNEPYFKTIVSIAASLVFILIAAKLLDLRVSYSGHELRIAFGEPVLPVNTARESGVTPNQIQYMIDQAIADNNKVVQANWSETHAQLDESIRKSLAGNNAQFNQLVKQVSSASEDQVRQYVLSMQTENSKLIQDYMRLTSNEQKLYMEELLTDFAKYMQQQRNNDLMLLQTQLNTVEQNTNLFKQETEQILTSIISASGETTNPLTNKY